MQQLDPPGVGARDLTEALCLQMEFLGSGRAAAVCGSFESHLDDVAANHYRKIARALKVDEDEVRRLVEVLRALNPRPAGAFSPGSLAGLHRSRRHAAPVRRRVGHHLEQRGRSFASGLAAIPLHAEERVDGRRRDPQATSRTRSARRRASSRTSTAARTRSRASRRSSWRCRASSSRTGRACCDRCASKTLRLRSACICPPSRAV